MSEADIEILKSYINAIDTFGTIDYKCINNLYEPVKNVLNELDKKDKVINKSIEQIEYIRQYFSEDCQADFIQILEILKDKNVIDW